MPASSSPKVKRAEKRVLWEMRQRYKLEPPKVTPATGSVGTPPSKRPPTPPRDSPKPTPKKPRRSRHILRSFIIAFLALGLVGGTAFSYKILSAGNKISVAKRSIFGQLKDLLLNSSEHLRGESDDRVNVLLLAIGGEGHAGENLSDSIMVASIRPSDHSVALLSIPRDLYVQVPEEKYYSKINAVHAYGEAKKKDFGPVLMKQKVEELTGLSIHYFARVDFTAFKSLVDAVGGINITIPNSFFDYWHKISFPAGTEDMNGDRALAYVRARYIEGPEGGDFKRAHRQQQVLLAIRDRIFSVSTALDFSKLNTILDSVSNNVRTDMQLWEMKRFYEVARQIDHEKVTSVVLSNGTKGVLVSGTEILGGQPAYVLKTRSGDYSEIQAIAQNIFTSNAASTLTPTPEDTLTAPSTQASVIPSPSVSPVPSKTPTNNLKITVEIRNGTVINGLAKKVADKVKVEGFVITGISNAKQRDAEITTVYGLSPDSQAEATRIATLLKATVDHQQPVGESPSKATILVITGADAAH